MKILIKAIGDMTEEELRALIDELGLTTTSVTGPAVVAAMQASVHVGGFMSYQIAVIVANSIARALLGRGLSLAANAALTRSISVLAGPIGIAATALWTTLLIAGPAYRVTTPATALVAYMRQKKYKDER